MRSGGPPEQPHTMSTTQEISVKDETGSNKTIDFDCARMHSDLSLS